MKELIITGCVVLGLIIVASVIWAVKYFRPLNYQKKHYWAFWPEKSCKEADCFLVYPTVDMGKLGNFFADVTSKKFRSKATGTLKQMEGLYNDVCDIYAPYYRQLTLKPALEYVERFEAYTNLAYNDVKSAFCEFLKKRDSSKPFYLAGFSQGAALALLMYKEVMKDPKISKNVVACYAIGWGEDEKFAAKNPQVKFARGETDTGVVIAYNTEAVDYNGSENLPKLFSINPLNWKTDGTFADKSRNMGACFFDTYGNLTDEKPNFCGAYIDEKTNRLKVPDVSAEEYPGRIMPDGIFHIYDYMFFYKNLRENVKTRLKAYKKQSSE